MFEKVLSTDKERKWYENDIKMILHHHDNPEDNRNSKKPL